MNGIFHTFIAISGSPLWRIAALSPMLTWNRSIFASLLRKDVALDGFLAVRFVVDIASQHCMTFVCLPQLN